MLQRPRTGCKKCSPEAAGSVCGYCTTFNPPLEETEGVRGGGRGEAGGGAASAHLFGREAFCKEAARGVGTLVRLRGQRGLFLNVHSFIYCARFILASPS